VGIAEFKRAIEVKFPESIHADCHVAGVPRAVRSPLACRDVDCTTVVDRKRCRECLGRRHL
jgi:hypothetical protein